MVKKERVQQVVRSSIRVRTMRKTRERFYLQVDSEQQDLVLMLTSLLALGNKKVMVLGGRRRRKHLRRGEVGRQDKNGLLDSMLDRKMYLIASSK